MVFKAYEVTYLASWDEKRLKAIVSAENEQATEGVLENAIRDCNDISMKVRQRPGLTILDKKDLGYVVDKEGALYFQK